MEAFLGPLNTGGEGGARERGIRQGRRVEERARYARCQDILI